LTLETEIRKHGTARSRWHTAISRDGSPICDIDAEVVCINLRTGQPMRMPCTIDRALGRAAKEWIGVPAALAV
jgi:acyl-CoA thioesterase FadM